MSDTLLSLQDELSKHLDGILALFKKGAKVTLVIRNPGTRGDAGVVIGNDDLDEAIEEIRKRRAGAGPAESQ